MSFGPTPSKSYVRLIAIGSVSTNEANGTLYYLASANATETDVTVKAGSSQAVTATGEQPVTITGLTAATPYYPHYLHRDAAGNDSAVASGAQFTTAAANTSPSFTGPNIAEISGTEAEALTLQGLPSSWSIAGTTAQRRLQIGNSCPPVMGRLLTSLNL